MKITMTVGTPRVALSGSVALSGRPAAYGWQAGCPTAHLAQFRNRVAPIGIDVPVTDRMRMSAAEP
ncbi:MAG: hypothetical protein ACRDRZ_01895 [Pseudonocardiaceae bacterium]